ncbi:MAG TPA: DUF1178 family protein [Mesorhizobium sp.]|jgi:hypothetical protein|nr:DUF1178 family protein [Mesorhizobium sp.]
MIRFSLSCERGHGFEGWFRDNADFDRQKEVGILECPSCASKQVGKALMAPAVATAKKREQVMLAMGAEHRKAMAELKALTEKLKSGAEDVGDRFADEARKIHFGETEKRGIFGRATPEEAAGLAEDGVDFLPLPVLPDDRN